MQTAASYFDVRPDKIQAAKILCGRLNDSDSQENHLLKQAMKSAGAMLSTWCVCKHLGHHNVVVTIHAKNVRAAAARFKGSREQSARTLRELLDEVLVTRLEDDPWLQL